MTVLVIAAHPDDEVLGCGGTIARLAQTGIDVYIAILGEGITSRYASRDQADNILVQKLQADSQRVADFLGAKALFRFGFPDNRFDTVPLLDVIKVVEQLLEQLEPKEVYTQHGGDLNIDHNIVYRATLTATRPMRGETVKRLYAYEVMSSSEWAFQKFSPTFHPTTFVDISSTLETKIQAMQLYESETRSFPHPRSPDALRAYARKWGSAVGVQAAEAYELIREIR